MFSVGPKYPHELLSVGKVALGAGFMGAVLPKRWRSGDAAVGYDMNAAILVGVVRGDPVSISAQTLWS